MAWHGRGGPALVGALLLYAAFLTVAQQTFLGEELPLKVLVTTPTDILDNDGQPVTVTGRDTITAVFSRPVIALGSDFGEAELPAALVPFSLSCGSLGRFRWVTTSIARWDPRIDWPTDLKCTLTWNKDLKSFDGAPLVLPDQPSVVLTTSGMSMSLSSVTSAKAEELTDQQWDANLGLEENEQPEVPPDANITLSFTYPIQLDLLAKALKLTPASGQTITVLPCQPPEVLLPLAGAKAAEVIRKAPLNCALVQLRPGLPLATSANLELPAGSKYNDVAGALGQAQTVQVVGLRRFRIPLYKKFAKPFDGKSQWTEENSGESSPRYRRLTLWLPHGLASNVNLGQLQAKMSICIIKSSQCLKFSLTRPTKGTLLMSVPDLAPSTQYRLAIQADATIKDGFDLPLQASSADFWTPALETTFQGPNLQAQVAIFEPSSSAIPWTYVSKGPIGTLKTASNFTLNPGAGTFASGLYSLENPGNIKLTALGIPAGSVTRGNGQNPEFSSLSIPGSAGMSLITTCCYDRGGGPMGAPQPAYSSSQLVVRSSLQLAIITTQNEWTAWVTDTAEDSKFVEGAKVQVWMTSWSTSTSLAGPTCTTGKSGTCTLKSPDFANYQNFYQWMALVTPPSGGKQGHLLVKDVSRIGTTYDSVGRSLVAKLVLDRRLVKPTQKLYVKAYVLRQDGTSLKLPAGGLKASWQINPNFDPTNGSPWTQATTIDPAFGTAEGIIDLPEGAKFGEYSISLLVSDPPSGGDVAVGSESFTMADPRPPTAELTLTAPAWVKPKDTVKVEIEAMSYLGSSVANAEIDVKWSTGKADGTSKPVTDSKGKAQVTIPLGKLPEANISQTGSTLTVDAVWIGPTRERITATKSIKIEDGPIKVSLSRTLITDLPGVPFGVIATTTKSEDDKPTESLDVTVTLVAAPNATLPEGCAAKAAAQKCTIKSGTASAAACQITLPCPGEFRLQGCTSASSSSGSSCSSDVLLGRNSTWWDNVPWSSQLGMNLILDEEGEYELGKEVGVQVQNPWWGPTSAMVIWGNAIARKTLMLEKVAAGPSTIKLGAVGEECRGGCRVVVVMSVSRPDAAPKNLPPVKISALFDPAAPHVQSGSVDVKIKQDTALKVSISGTKGSGAKDKLVVAPESSSSITVKVLLPDGKTAASGAQVTLVGVDKALLDLLPYPLQDVNAALQPSLTQSIDVQNFNRLRVAPGAINATYTALRRRLLQLDPFLPADTQIQPSYYSWEPRFWGRGGDVLPSVAAVDIPDARYLAQYSSPVTPLPYSGICTLGRVCPVSSGFGGGMANMAMEAMPAMAASALPRKSAMMKTLVAAAPAPAPGSAALDGVAQPEAASGGSASTLTGAPEDPTRKQEDFNTTPVWATRTTGSDGSVTFTFKAPVNLGSFVIRAYAVDPVDAASVPKGGRQASYGGAESALIVRRPVSLEASVPRIVRVGDAFEAGVLVTGSLGSSPVNVVTSVTIGGTGLKLDGPGSITASLSGELQQREVRFRFKATAIGNATLKFKVTTPSGGDALEWVLPVLGKQGEVFVATSFAVKPGTNGSTSGRAEGLKLPNAIPGSGNLQLMAGVGYLPAIQATYIQLVNQNDREWPEATQSLSLGLMPTYIAPYQPAGKAPKDYVNLVPNQLSSSITALNDIVDHLTDPTYGLLYTDPRRGQGWQPTRADIDLNSWAVWLVESSKDDATRLNADAGFSKSWKAVQDQVPIWRAALERQLVADGKSARNSNPPYAYPSLETLSWARLVLGASWNPSDVAPIEVVNDLSMSRLVKEAVNMTVGAQARIGLTLAASGKSKGDVDKIVRRLSGWIRVGGRTAYVAIGKGERGAAPLADQALALQLFLATKTSNELVEKLTNYIAAGNPPPRYAPLCVSVGGWSAALASDALRAYDASTSSTNPNLSFKAVAASNTTTEPIFSYTFNSSNAGVLVRSKPKPWSEVPRDSQLQITASGSGQASVAASLNFIPNELMPFPSYRGLWVQRVLQRADAQGGSLSAVPLKTMTTTVVQVTTPDDMSKVIVEVMMPGGLEPLDPLIYPDPEAATVCKQGDDEEDITELNNGFGGGRPIGFSGGPMVMPMPRVAVSQSVMPASDMISESAPGQMGRRLMSSVPFWWRPWPVCPEQTTQPAVVTFTFSFMRAGTHTIRFQSIAATPGTFVLPPVKAYVEQQPEIMGLSPAGSFKVCATADNCDGELEPSAAAKSCPKDCNSNGSCNLASGKCLCNRGFSGDDCSKFADF